MTRINLLPWREELRKERQTQFIIMIACAAVLGAIVWGAGHLHYSTLIDNQQARNRVLEREIKELESKISEIETLEATKANLLARMDVIQQLQQGRPQIVHLLHQLAISIPDGVHLTKMTQKDSMITLSGAAESNARISSFMESLDRSNWLTDPKLDVIQVKDATASRKKVSEFELQVRQEGVEPAGQTAKDKAPAKKTPARAKAS